MIGKYVSDFFYKIIGRGLLTLIENFKIKNEVENSISVRNSMHFYLEKLHN